MQTIDEPRAVAKDADRARSLPPGPLAVLLIDASHYVDPPDDAGPQARRVRRAAAVADCVRRWVDPVEVTFSDRDKGLLSAVVACAPPDDVEDRGAATSEEGRQLAWLKRRATELRAHLVDELRADMPIGVGLPHRGPNAAMRSYKDACAALVLARGRAGDAVACLDDAGLAGLVEAPGRPSRRVLAARLLGPLDGEPALAETLAVYFASNCSPSETASRLGLHRNTLAYRLQRIARLTGLHPAKFEDAVQLRVAMEAAAPRRPR